MSGPGAGEGAGNCELCWLLVLASPELLNHRFGDPLGPEVASDWFAGPDGRLHWGPAGERGACGTRTLPETKEVPR